jgi:hypothetical protein
MQLTTQRTFENRGRTGATKSPEPDTHSSKENKEKSKRGRLRVEASQGQPSALNQAPTHPPYRREEGYGALEPQGGGSLEGSL